MGCKEISASTGSNVFCYEKEKQGVKWKKSKKQLKRMI